MLYWIRRHAAWLMIVGGVCLSAGCLVWFSLIRASSIDWSGSAAVSLWFGRAGPSLAIFATCATLLSGFTLIVLGVCDLARGSRKSRPVRP